VEVEIQLMSISMLKIMEFQKKVVSPIKLKIQIHPGAQLSISAEIALEFKALTLIIKETVGLNRDIKCGKLNNTVKYPEPKP
jgi:hypothetical protein